MGEMLCDQYSKRPDVEAIFVVDKEPQSAFSKQIPKLTYLQTNLADGVWQAVAMDFKPDTIIHTAWQIRAMYGREEEQWRWNVGGSEAVFQFAFTNDFVQKLIYFSTASSYGARQTNRMDHYFTEAEGFRDDEYIYAHEKMMVEKKLQSIFDHHARHSVHLPQVTVFRPAAITGPRGRYMRIRFGLQSALQGNLDKSFVNKMVTTLTSFVPATKGWVRQFIHEDDVTDAVASVVFTDHKWHYETFNLTPEGAPVLPADMAKAVGKRILPIQPWMAQSAFFVFWHLTQGKIPTCPGSWRFYSYPILMSGKKLTRIHACKYQAREAFALTSGRYEQYVPEAKRVTVQQ